MIIEYRDSVLEEVPEECSEDCIVRYRLDRDNWIDVTATPRGIEVRSNGGKMSIEPQSGNTIEVYLRKRG